MRGKEAYVQQLAIIVPSGENFTAVTALLWPRSISFGLYCSLAGAGCGCGLCAGKGTGEEAPGSV